MIDFINDKRYELLCALAEVPGCALLCMPLHEIGTIIYGVQYEYKEPNFLRLVYEMGLVDIYQELNDYAYNWLD